MQQLRRMSSTTLGSTMRARGGEYIPTRRRSRNDQQGKRDDHWRQAMTFVTPRRWSTEGTPMVHCPGAAESTHFAAQPFIDHAKISSFDAGGHSPRRRAGAGQCRAM